MLWKNKNNYETWFKAYLSQKLLVDHIKEKFVAKTTWGNIEKD